MSGIVLEVLEPPVEQQVCRICGARRRRDEQDEQWIADRHVAFRQHEVRRVRDPDGGEHGEVGERPWHRRHIRCEPTAAAVVAAITGVELDEQTARGVIRDHGRTLTADDRQASVRAPWAFLTRKEVGEVTALAVAAAAPTEPTEHPDGRCGVCGVGRSLSWTRPGLRWSTGTAAPVCACCQVFYPSTGDDDLLRIRALADLAGTRPTPSLRAHDTFGYRHAFEVLRPDELHDAEAGRWEYRAPTLNRIRAAVAAALPELLLDDEARARGVEMLDRRRARAASEEARRQAGAAVGAGSADW